MREGFDSLSLTRVLNDIVYLCIYLRVLACISEACGLFECLPRSMTIAWRIMRSKLALDFFFRYNQDCLIRILVGIIRN